MRATNNTATLNMIRRRRRDEDFIEIVEDEESSLIVDLTHVYCRPHMIRMTTVSEDTVTIHASDDAYG
jgi:hypothetical protein